LHFFLLLMQYAISLFLLFPVYRHVTCYDMKSVFILYFVMFFYVLLSQSNLSKKKSEVKHLIKERTKKLEDIKQSIKVIKVSRLEEEEGEEEEEEEEKKKRGSKLHVCHFLSSSCPFEAKEISSIWSNPHEAVWGLKVKPVDIIRCRQVESSLWVFEAVCCCFPLRVKH